MSPKLSTNWLFAPRRITDISQIDSIENLKKSKRWTFYWFVILCLAQGIVLISIGAYAYSYRNELAIYDLRDSWVFSLPGPRRLKEFLENSGKGDLLASIAIDYEACLILQALALSLIAGRMLCVLFGWVKYPIVIPLKGKTLALMLLIVAVALYPNIRTTLLLSPEDREALYISRGLLWGYLYSPTMFVAENYALCLFLWLSGRL